MWAAPASRIPGTLVNQVIGREAATTGKLRIGHPMGVTAVSVEA